MVEVDRWLLLATNVGIFFNGYWVGVWRQQRSQMKYLDEQIKDLESQLDRRP